MSLITAAVIVVLVIGAAVVFKSRNPGQAKKAEPEKQEPSKPAENEYETILNALLKLNLMMRKDKGFLKTLTLEIESVIDDLMVITPAMIERYPGETLTYEIKKIGQEHLYKTVKEYLDLSPESRENQAAVFKQTIDSLKEISNRARDIVEKNETAEFKTMANFLSGKFSG